jgi:hypothetical protein
VTGQTGILMNVHPVPWDRQRFDTFSFLGPDRMDNLLRAHN